MRVALTGRVRFTKAFQSQSFALLWAGQTISALGDGAFLTALAWQILLLTGSATAMGIVLAAQALPRVLFLLLGGVAADRLPRRLVMLWSDTGRAILVLAIAGLSWVHLLQLWHLVTLAFCFGIVQGFFLPAYQAIRPQLVERESLPSANALTGLSLYSSQLLGPVLGAGFVALAGPMSAFVFDGLTFVVSAFCLLALRLPPSLPGTQIAPHGDSEKKEPRSKAVRQGHGIRGLITDVREGLSYVTGSTWLWLTILVASVGNIGWNGPLAAALPKLVYSVYGSGVWLLGVLGTAIAIGSMAATIFVGQVARQHRRGLLAYLSLIISSLAIVAFGLPLPRVIKPAVATCAGILFGLGVGAFTIIWETVLQELVPGDKVGRVSSIDMLGSLCLLPVGYAIMGILADHIGPSSVFVMGGLLCLVLTGIALCVRDIRRLD